ncbi:hypothetical protein BH18ACT5_BH18ACT5_07580 [soil metagenome]
MITVRRGRPEDLETVTAFTAETFAWGDYVSGAFPFWLDEPDADVLVAVNDEDVVIAIVHVRQMSAQEGWISGARVAPDHRRQGVGSVLNGAAVDWLRERGVLVARLTTELDNEAAKSQVEKLGYHQVARFIYGRREFVRHGAGANGGKRLPSAEQFDLAPSAEAEPAFVVFQSGELARAGHGLYAPKGWDFRRLHHADLVKAARHRQLWTSPSGWAVTTQDESQLWIGVLVTTAEDARAAVRALVDLAAENRIEVIEMMVPRVPWLEEALVAEHIELGHSNLVYELPIG